jgi:hypothetical protein
MSGDIFHDLFTVFHNQDGAKHGFCLGQAKFNTVGGSTSFYGNSYCPPLQEARDSIHDSRQC